MISGVFRLVRLEDVSGVAGTGIVALGYMAPNGKAALFWNVVGKPQNVVIADSFEDLSVHFHDGRTVVQWIWTESGEYGKSIP